MLAGDRNGVALISSSVGLEQFAAFVTHIGITFEQPAEPGGGQRARQSHEYRHEKQHYHDDHDAGHARTLPSRGDQRGLYAQASISTSAPRGRAATATVERAGRVSPKPAM